MAWLTPPRITGVVIATAFFFVVGNTIPKPAAGAVLGQGVKVHDKVGVNPKVTQQPSKEADLPWEYQDKKCVLNLGILGCLDAAWGFLSREAKELLKLIWTLAKAAGFPLVHLPRKDVCYDIGCLEAAYDVLQAMDASKNPCQDFYLYSCGRWIENNPVPPTSSRWNRLNVLREEVNKKTQEILNEEQNNADALPINQVKQFYKDCIDLEAMEAKGLDPLLSIISEFGGWPLLDPAKWKEDEFDLVKTTAEVLRRTPQVAVIYTYVAPDVKDTRRSVIYFDQPTFGLPRSILTARDDFQEIMESYESYIMNAAKELRSVLNDVDLSASVKSLIDFEVRLAEISKSAVDRGDMERLYNPKSLSQFQSDTDAIDPEFTISWKKFLDQYFSSSGVTISDDEFIIVRELEYYHDLISVLKNTPKSTLANYVLWRLVDGFISDTTEAMRNIAFNFEKVLTGATEPNPRDVACADAALSVFGMAIGVKYIETEFDEEAKDEAIEIAVNVKVAFKGMIEEEEWMKDVTKKAAIEKVDAMRTMIGYPDWLKDKTAVEAFYQGLVLGDSHFPNQLNIVLYLTNKWNKALREPTDKDEWVMDPPVVNAGYSQSRNSITIPAAILRSPFFAKGRPKSLNYGGIGMPIGHETLHGFDSEGSEFDKDGNLNIWWDDVTLAEFNKRAQCMAEQYSRYLVKPINKFINGALTLAENIADNGGLSVSFKAYQKYTLVNGPEKKLPGLETIPPNQLYFIGFAQIWCESITPEELENRLLTDPHSPAEYRVKGSIRNSKEFAQTFACPVDENGMNPPESQECKVF